MNYLLRTTVTYMVGGPGSSEHSRCPAAAWARVCCRVVAAPDTAAPAVVAAGVVDVVSVAVAVVDAAAVGWGEAVSNATQIVAAAAAETDWDSGVYWRASG